MATSAATAWVFPARALAEGLGPGLEAVWAMIFAAQTATLQLAQITPLDDDRPLSAAAWELEQALEELERVRPELSVNGLALDLGPPPLEAAQPCREAVAGLIGAALGMLTARLPDGGNGRDVTELLALARAATLVATARHGLTGGLGSQVRVRH